MTSLRGHLPTYIAIPLFAVVFFFAAAIQPWLTLLTSGSVPAAVALAMGWAALLPVLLQEGRVHTSAALAGIVTLFAAPPLGEWLAETLGWPAAVTQVALVESVMLTLAVASLTIGWRSKVRERERS